MLPLLYTLCFPNYIWPRRHLNKISNQNRILMSQTTRKDESKSKIQTKSLYISLVKNRQTPKPSIRTKRSSGEKRAVTNKRSKKLIKSNTRSDMTGNSRIQRQIFPTHGSSNIIHQIGNHSFHDSFLDWSYGQYTIEYSIQPQYFAGLPIAMRHFHKDFLV
jgi:hypothetical protein